MFPQMEPLRKSLTFIDYKFDDLHRRSSYNARVFLHRRVAVDSDRRDDLSPQQPRLGDTIRRENPVPKRLNLTTNSLQTRLRAPELVSSSAATAAATAAAETSNDFKKIPRLTRRDVTMVTRYCPPHRQKTTFGYSTDRKNEAEFGNSEQRLFPPVVADTSKRLSRHHSKNNVIPSFKYSSATAPAAVEASNWIVSHYWQEPTNGPSARLNTDLTPEVRIAGNRIAAAASTDTSNDERSGKMTQKRRFHRSPILQSTSRVLAATTAVAVGSRLRRGQTSTELQTSNEPKRRPTVPQSVFDALNAVDSHAAVRRNYFNGNRPVAVDGRPGVFDKFAVKLEINRGADGVASPSPLRGEDRKSENRRSVVERSLKKEDDGDEPELIAFERTWKKSERFDSKAADCRRNSAESSSNRSGVDENIKRNETRPDDNGGARGPTGSAKTWKTWRSVNESDVYTDVRRYIVENDLMSPRRRRRILDWLQDSTQPGNEFVTPAGKAHLN